MISRVRHTPRKQISETRRLQTALQNNRGTRRRSSRPLWSPERPTCATQAVAAYAGVVVCAVRGAHLPYSRVNCPACGAAARRSRLVNGNAIHRCSSCGHGFVEPRPTVGEQVDLYKQQGGHCTEP